MNERLGYLAHELRNQPNGNPRRFGHQSGDCGVGRRDRRRAGPVLDWDAELIDRSLADVRVTAGMPPRHQLISLADFIADVKISASLEAQARECTFTVGDVDTGLAVDADREMLFSAVGNLLQNAFKFTQRHTEVSLNAYAAAGRIRIAVEDRCGGLPKGFAEEGFPPFAQSGADRSGMGLGLAICLRSVEETMAFSASATYHAQGVFSRLTCLATYWRNDPAYRSESDGRRPPRICAHPQ